MIIQRGRNRGKIGTPIFLIEIIQKLYVAISFSILFWILFRKPKIIIIKFILSYDKKVFSVANDLRK